MNCLGDQILAGSGFTQQKDGGAAAGGHILDQLIDVFHLTGFTDEMIEAILSLHALAIIANLSLQPGGLEAAFDLQHQFIDLEGFAHEVIGTEFHGLHGDFDFPKGRHENHDHVWIKRSDSPQHFDSIYIGQLVIQHDQVVAALAKQGQTLLAGLGLIAQIAFGAETLFQGPSNELLVFDDQHLGWIAHMTLLVSPVACGLLGRQISTSVPTPGVLVIWRLPRWACTM